MEGWETENVKRISASIEALFLTLTYNNIVQCTDKNTNQIGILGLLLNDGLWVKASVETVLQCISTFSGLKIIMGQQNKKHSSVLYWNFDRKKKQKQTITSAPYT